MSRIVSLAVCLLPLCLSQFCPSGFVDLLNGTPCDNTNTCNRLSNYGNYQCVEGYCCRQIRSGFCSVNEISIAGTCFRISGEGGPCIYTAQCQPNSLMCRNGFCRNPYMDEQNPTCRDESQQVERVNGYVKSCMTERCSFGFQCEYHRTYQGGQYICCGSHQQNDYDYGTVRLYPGTNLPLQCYESNSCLWIDTPNCVYSQRYGHKVCCSTFVC